MEFTLLGTTAFHKSCASSSFCYSLVLPLYNNSKSGEDLACLQAAFQLLNGWHTATRGGGCGMLWTIINCLT